MRASMSAVAPIWVTAPAITQGQNVPSGEGSSVPVRTRTAASARSANGKPNRKRTWVAPTVPSAPVSSRCMAFRPVCAAAASSVAKTQSGTAPIMPRERSS